MTKRHLVSKSFIAGDIDLAEDYEFIPASGSEEHVIITIHGIRTIGSWADDFIANNPLRGIVRIDKISIGWVDIVTFLFWNCRSIFQRAAQDLDYIIKENPDKKISVICHSFGTKVLSKIINGIDCKFHHVYFIGGVANKDDYISVAKKASCFVNDCGRRDYWPCVAHFIRPKKYEAIGYYGTQPVGVNRDFDSDHSEYASASHINSNIIPSIIDARNGVYRPRYNFVRTIPTYCYNGFLRIGIIAMLFLFLSILLFGIYCVFNISCSYLFGV